MCCNTGNLSCETFVLLLFFKRCSQEGGGGEERLEGQLPPLPFSKKSKNLFTLIILKQTCPTLERSLAKPEHIFHDIRAHGQCGWGTGDKICKCNLFSGYDFQFVCYTCFHPPSLKSWLHPCYVLYQRHSQWVEFHM